MFDSRDGNHLCEECGVFVGDVFETDSGQVLNRYKYSHILPKSHYPQFRHDVRNMNYLCMDHHNMWHSKDRSLMKIYNDNLVIINELKGLRWE